MDIMLFYILNPLVNALVATILGFVVYFRNRKEFTNKIFAIFCGSVALWSYAYFALFFVEDASAGLFYHKLFLTVPAIFISILFFHFVIAFISKTKESRKALIIGYFIFSFFVLINLFTPYFIEKLENKLFLGLWPSAGPLYLPFLLIWWFYFIWTIYLIAKEIKTLSNNENFQKKRAQLKYILTGALIGFGGGGVINYLLWYDIPVPPVTSFLIAIGMIVIAYGIIKHHLFNIKLLISELLVFTIWVFVIVRTALSNSYQDFWINGILAVLVFAVGVLLMRSVSKEVEAERKALGQTKQSLDFERRLKETFAEIAEEQTKKIEKIIFNKKDAIDK